MREWKTSMPVIRSVSDVKSKPDIESEPIIGLEGLEAIARDLKELSSQFAQCKVCLGSPNKICPITYPFVGDPWNIQDHQPHSLVYRDVGEPGYRSWVL